MYPYNKCVEGASSRGANNWHYGQGNGCMFGVGCLLDHGHLFKKKAVLTSIYNCWLSRSLNQLFFPFAINFFVYKAREFGYQSWHPHAKKVVWLFSIQFWQLFPRLPHPCPCYCDEWPLYYMLSIKTIRSTKSVVANLLHLVNIFLRSLHSAKSCQTLAVILTISTSSWKS